MSNLSFRTTTVRRTGLLTAALLAVASCNVSHAVTVTNLNSNTIVFADSFESGSLSASVGTWSRIGPLVDVINSTVAPAPGPAEGSFYASFFRQDLTTPSQGDALGTLGQVQSVTGDVVRLSFMLNVPDDGVNDRARLFLSDGDYVNIRAIVRTDGAGNVLSNDSGGVFFDTGIDYVPGAWQRWDLDYEIGSTTFSLRVGDAFAAGLQARSAGQVSMFVMANGNGIPAGAFYADAVPVPEPGTYGLLVAGLVFVGVAAARRGRVHQAEAS